MRVLLQRVTDASVEVDGQVVGEIGLCVVALVGVGHDDTTDAAEWLADKTSRVRIFADDAGKTNRSLVDVGGQALVVSQFTLYADTSRGNRPGFTQAADPAIADRLVTHYRERLEANGVRTGSGVFGAYMQVRLTNDGPFTIVLER